MTEPQQPPRRRVVVHSTMTITVRRTVVRVPRHPPDDSTSLVSDRLSHRTP